MVIIITGFIKSYGPKPVISEEIQIYQSYHSIGSFLSHFFLFRDNFYQRSFAHIWSVNKLKKAPGTIKKLN